jgi:hypothetical protein
MSQTQPERVKTIPYNLAHRQELGLVHITDGKFYRQSPRDKVLYAPNGQLTTSFLKIGPIRIGLIDPETGQTTHVHDIPGDDFVILNNCIYYIAGDVLACYTLSANVVLSLPLPRGEKYSLQASSKLGLIISNPKCYLTYICGGALVEHRSRNVLSIDETHSLHLLEFGQENIFTLRVKKEGERDEAINLDLELIPEMMWVIGPTLLTLENVGLEHRSLWKRSLREKAEKKRLLLQKQEQIKVEGSYIYVFNQTDFYVICYDLDFKSIFTITTHEAVTNLFLDGGQLFVVTTGGIEVWQLPTL